MNGFIRKGAVVVVAGMLLTGCGGELKTLTESEEAIIVNYSAGTVSKFNKRQLDGMTAVVLPEEETDEDEMITPEEKPSNEEQDNKEDNKKEDNIESASESSQVKEEKTQKNLTQMLAISGVEVKYTGYEIKEVYEENDYFSMAAQTGKTYFVMKYTISNKGNQETVCDVLSKKPVFSLSLNGKAGVKNEVTMLPNDLSTYMASLAPGTSAQAVLIFEVPVEETKDITSVQAQVQINGNNGNAVE